MSEACRVASVQPRPMARRCPPPDGRGVVEAVAGRDGRGRDGRDVPAVQHLGQQADILRRAARVFSARTATLQGALKDRHRVHGSFGRVREQCARRKTAISIGGDFLEVRSGNTPAMWYDPVESGRRRQCADTGTRMSWACGLQEFRSLIPGPPHAARCSAFSRSGQDQPRGRRHGGPAPRSIF